MEVSIGYWIGFFVFIIVMLALDLGVFHRTNEAPTIKSSLLWSAFWIGLAFIFAGGIWVLAGGHHALDFVTAYLLEKSLSIDNIFIFILVFNFFKIDAKYQHRLLFWGVFGALVMRVLFIFAGVVLLDKFKWLMVVFGLFLVITGIKMLFEKEESGDLNNNFIIKTLRRLFPFKEDAPVAKFFVKIDGKRFATQFLIALLFIEASDLIFAVDSIPAVLSVSQNSFIVVTSNIFAIMGLRSLYFAVSGILPLFRYIKYALAAILAFIGFKMVLNEAAHYFDFNLHISNISSLVVIISLITLSIIASIIADRAMQRKRL
ncbi:TerC/Alx family metal homeostasis membrane protein [Loigolactobacillus coryniformis]|uniref:TerC/Alx family metal homeostasis membrane protein n=1 Tax=Loigolactobacillus coryniformis TaxID=1610 RepID=UPI002341579E|nr:TerC/Alx family metal homeostasis membrane protein [Loigolactobacillus coryniformis]MDC4187079.1 TerC/Alx family metal homeostasis membrane protein [Loigolactobacillus coryniformis]